MRIRLTGLGASILAITFLIHSAAAEDGRARLPAGALPSFSDAALDAALAELSKVTELAVVQVDRLAALAAKKGEPADMPAEARERRVGAIVELLYSDQIEPFQAAYEATLGADEAAARQWARARLGTLFGRMEVNADLRGRALAAAIACCREACRRLVALDAAHKGADSDADYREKREGLLAPVRAKSYVTVRALLPPGKQKEMDDEWKRRQERRIGFTLKDLGREFAPRTDEQRTKVEAATAAFRAAAKDLDLDSPEYGVCAERYRRELAAALKSASDSKRQPAGVAKETP